MRGLPTECYGEHGTAPSAHQAKARCAAPLQERSAHRLRPLNAVAVDQFRRAALLPAPGPGAGKSFGMAPGVRPPKNKPARSGSPALLTILRTPRFAAVYRRISTPRSGLPLPIRMPGRPVAGAQMPGALVAIHTDPNRSALL